MKKRILIIVFIISLIIHINYIYANTEEETIASQQEEFKIDEFITKSKEYSGEFFGGINIQDLLNSAIKGEVDNTTIIKRIINLFRSGGNIQSKSNRKHISNNCYSCYFKVYW